MNQVSRSTGHRPNKCGALDGMKPCQPSHNSDTLPGKSASKIKTPETAYDVLQWYSPNKPAPAFFDRHFPILPFADAINNLLRWRRVGAHGSI
jgi:hypothetical protein